MDLNTHGHQGNNDFLYRRRSNALWTINSFVHFPPDRDPRAPDFNKFLDSYGYVLKLNGRYVTIDSLRGDKIHVPHGLVHLAVKPWFHSDKELKLRIAAYQNQKARELEAERLQWPFSQSELCGYDSDPSTHESDEYSKSHESDFELLTLIENIRTRACFTRHHHQQHRE